MYEKQPKDIERESIHFTEHIQSIESIQYTIDPTQVIIIYK